MGEWWSSLDTLIKVLYCVAIPSSMILVIQMIMSFMGFGESGAGVGSSDTSGLGMNGTDIDFDVDTGEVNWLNPNVGDGGNPADFGTLRLFTLQGIVSFLVVFGWSSIALIAIGTHEAVGLICGAVLGLIAMLGVAKLIQLSMRLSENGALNIKNAIGEVGTVYIPIPANGEDGGKITITVQGRFIESSAITFGEALKMGTSVRVIDIRSDVVVVEKDS